MSVIKRISASIYARVDRLVGDFENHDAIAESTIGAARQALARAKVRLARVTKDGERMAQQLSATRREEALWIERARSSADQEATALQCLRRRRACSRRAQELEQALDLHREAEKKLAEETRLAEERLDRLVERHHVMRSRESAALACGKLEEHSGVASADLEGVFDRWEERITEAELGLDLGVKGDALGQHFQQAEELESLHAELRDLDKEIDDGH